MSVPANRPLFVVGAPRSGTTLLRYMLCAHPRLYIPPESNFIPRFFRRHPTAELSPAAATHILAQLLHYHVFFRDWQAELPDPAGFVAALPRLTPETLLNALYRQYAGQFGAERWGDKSPIYTGHLQLLNRIFPTAQVVHIIRDGRAVALSMLKAYRKARFFYVDVCFAAHSWQRRVRQARAAAAAPGRYYEVRYEQLVTDPEAALRGICAFLGEQYVPAMSEPHKEARTRYHSRGIHAATRQPPSGRSLDRWQQELSPVDQRLFQAIAGDLLHELGYEPLALGNMGPAEWARYLLLQAKYFTIEAGRSAVQAAGIFHPTALLTYRPKSRSKQAYG